MEQWSVQVTIKKEEWLDDPPMRWNHGLSQAGKEWKRQNRMNPGSRSGALARNSNYKILQRGKTIQFISVFYWVFLMKGTGIYGPTGQPITPKNGSVLAWKVQGAGMLKIASGIGFRSGSSMKMPSRNIGMIFARSVKGVLWPGRLDEIRFALKQAFVQGIKRNADD